MFAIWLGYFDQSVLLRKDIVEVVEDMRISDRDNTNTAFQSIVPVGCHRFKPLMFVCEEVWSKSLQLQMPILAC